jgi:hypothetical protein
VVQRYNGPVMEILEETHALIQEVHAEFAAWEGLTWAVILTETGRVV